MLKKAFKPTEWREALSYAHKLDEHNTISSSRGAASKNSRHQSKGGRRYKMVCICSQECLDGAGYAVEIKDDIEKQEEEDGSVAFVHTGITVSSVGENAHGTTKLKKAAGRGARARAGGKYEPRAPGTPYNPLHMAMKETIIDLSMSNKPSEIHRLMLDKINKMPGDTEDERVARAAAKDRLPAIEQIQDVIDNAKKSTLGKGMDIITNADVFKWAEARELSLSSAPADELELIALPRQPSHVMGTVAFSARKHLQWVLNVMIERHIKGGCWAGDGRMKMINTSHTILTVSLALMRRSIKRPDHLTSTVKPLAWAVAESESQEAWKVLLYGLIQGIVIEGKGLGFRV